MTVFFNITRIQSNKKKNCRNANLICVCVDEQTISKLTSFLASAQEFQTWLQNVLQQNDTLSNEAVLTFIMTFFFFGQHCSTAP